MIRRENEALVRLRRELHQKAERSGSEEQTSARILEELEALDPDDVAKNVAGHGIIATYVGLDPGPTVLFRCELDALPIPESPESRAHASKSPGISHRCGHDGHMTIVTALAHEFARSRPNRGRVVLLYQPAEETGEGAIGVLESPEFRTVNPDFVFALHNLPGYEMGKVVVREGVFAATSCGLQVAFKGSTSHAAEPQLGCSPAMAVSQCVMALASFPQRHVGLDDSAKVTVTHVRVGERNFGTTPGEGELTATLRSMTTETMQLLKDRCHRLVNGLAATYDLEADVSWVEEFPISKNDPDVVAHITACAQSLGMEVEHLPTPMAWSEDFGHFTSRYKGALFGLGAGVKSPALHAADYDFPEELIPIGAGLFSRIARRLTGA